MMELFYTYMVVCRICQTYTVFKYITVTCTTQCNVAMCVCVLPLSHVTTSHINFIVQWDLSNILSPNLKRKHNLKPNNPHCSVSLRLDNNRTIYVVNCMASLQLTRALSFAMVSVQNMERPCKICNDKGSIIAKIFYLVFTAPTGDKGQLIFQIKLKSDDIQFCPTWIVSHYNT